MPHPKIDSKYQSDYLALRDVQERYFQAVDRGDVNGVRACFAPDLEATYHTRPTMRGLDAMMDATILPFFGKLKAGTTKVSTHFMGNFRIELLEGDVAETETYAIAVHVLGGGTTDQLSVMSMRYIDRLKRSPGGWSIVTRVQTMDWKTELPAAFAMTMAKRVMGLPKA
jgi:ketosteroid isomerase-like protein